MSAAQAAADRGRPDLHGRHRQRRPARPSTSTASGSTPSSTRRRSSRSPTPPAARTTRPTDAADAWPRSTTSSTRELVVKPETLEVTALFAGAGALLLLSWAAVASLAWLGRLP